MGGAAATEQPLPLASIRQKGEADERRSALVLITLLGASVFVAVVLLRAWQGDDAFITWRTASHLLQGRGLSFNVGQRVQAFTSPLWLLVGTLCGALFDEFYFSVLVVSALLAYATAARLLWVLRGQLLAQGVLVLTLLASPTAVDFSTSGLETPALMLLSASLGLAVFSQRMGQIVLCFCLLFFCRPDAALLALFPLLWTFRQPLQRARLARFAALGLLPIFVWEAFSLFYFGSLVPNTALAKLNSEVPRWEMLALGLHYAVDFARHEPWPAALVLAAALTGLVHRGSSGKVLAGSLLLHLAYVVWVGGDFMRGRFFVAPFWLSLAWLVALCGSAPLRARRRATLAALVAAALSLLLPWAPVRRLAPDGLEALGRSGGVIWERAYYARETSLLSVMGRLAEKEQRGFVLYEKARPCAELPLGKGRFVLSMEVGYCGFMGGPKLTVLDAAALTDPFLSRVPFVPSSSWRVGHLVRQNLRHYAEVRAGRRAFLDAGVAEAYGDVNLVTRGPLFSLGRVRAIFRLLAGVHAPAFRRYSKP